MANTNSNGASLKNILKVPEIQKRLLFTFLILVVVRFGAQIPIPGVSRDVFASWFAHQSNGAMALFVVQKQKLKEHCENDTMWKKCTIWRSLWNDRRY